MFDSHAHYDDAAFAADRNNLLSGMPTECGVSGIINAGCDIASSEYSIRMAEEYPHVFAAVGIHPQNASEVSDGWQDELKRLIPHKKVVAIGEIGLDFHYDTPEREVQQRVFDAQMQLAAETGMPVVIHDRDAHADCVKTVLAYPGVTGAFHCFSGSVETARLLIKNGWYISVGGVITFKNSRQLPAVVKDIPLCRLLTETDAPYLSPVPYRGQRNDSSLIRFTLDKIAEIKGITAEEAEKATVENAKRLFRIP